MSVGQQELDISKKTQISTQNYSLFFNTVIFELHAFPLTFLQFFDYFQVIRSKKVLKMLFDRQNYR